MLKVTTLASGSSGNAALISCGQTHILLDAGISARRITTGLRSAGVDPSQLSAIFITHEHSDHIAGLNVLTKQVKAPVVATDPTCRCILAKVPHAGHQLRSMKPGSGAQVGSLWVEPFATPHDAAGSVGYSISGEGGRLVLCTDLGYVTPEVEQAVRGCDLLICESNHDPEWVRSGRYPYYLQQRILGSHGHLSNEDGAELAAFAVENGTKAVILAHLSSENNTPAHAHRISADRLAATGCDPERDIHLSVAPRSEPGATFCLEAGQVHLKGGALC